MSIDEVRLGRPGEQVVEQSFPFGRVHPDDVRRTRPSSSDLRPDRCVQTSGWVLLGNWDQASLCAGLGFGYTSRWLAAMVWTTRSSCSFCF